MNKINPRTKTFWLSNKNKYVLPFLYQFINVQHLNYKSA